MVARDSPCFFDMALVPYGNELLDARPPPRDPRPLLAAAQIVPFAADGAAEPEQLHCEKHPAFCKDCGTCKWQRYGNKWTSVLTHENPLDTSQTCVTVSAKYNVSGYVSLGCSACSKAGCKSSWGNFAVRDESMFQLGNLVRHHNSEGHIRSLARLWNVNFTTLFNAMRNNDEGFNDRVPRAIKFAFAIHCCHTTASHRSYKEYMSYNKIAADSHINCLQDTSPSVVKQLQHCVSMAHIQGTIQPILRNAIRISQSTDDRDQNLSLRFRALTATPTLKLHDHWGGLLRDQGHCETSTADAMIKIWQYPRFR